MKNKTNSHPSAPISGLQAGYCTFHKRKIILFPAAKNTDVCKDVQYMIIKDL